MSVGADPVIIIIPLLLDRRAFVLGSG